MTYPKITSADAPEPDTDQPSEPPKMGAGGFLPPLPPIADAAARYIEVRANGERVSERGLTTMPFVHGLDGSSVQVSESSNAEQDALWLNLIGGTHTTTAAGDEERATAHIGIREAVVLAHCIVVIARHRGYSIPDTLTEASALAHEERKRWAEPEPEPEPAAAPEDFGADTLGALAEASEWARRWGIAHKRAEALADELARVDALHVPYVDEHGVKRCRGCIAGYDPRTRELTHCAWPCPTARARAGELPLL
jgi:hypothetical protein